MLCGDFKFHIIEQNALFTDFKQLLETTDFHQHIDFPTDFHGHILDLLTSPYGSDMIRDVKRCDWFSDHCCIAATISTSTPSNVYLP